MCLGAYRWDSSIPSNSHHCWRRLKKSKVRVRFPPRTIGRGMEMEVENLKLYLENRCIIEENERLRKRALALDQDNKALLSQLKKKFSHFDHKI